MATTLLKSTIIQPTSTVKKTATSKLPAPTSTKVTTAPIVKKSANSKPSESLPKSTTQTTWNKAKSVTGVKFGTTTASPTTLKAPRATFIEGSAQDPGASQYNNGFDTQGGLIDAKTGAYNTNYVPKSLEEINNVSDPYTRNYLAANYYKSKGLDWKTEGLAKNQDEANQLFIEGQKEEMSALDKEIAYAKDKMKKQLDSSTGAIKGKFAQSREGMVSEGNKSVATETIKSMSDEVGQQFNALEQRKRQLEKLQQQQQTEYTESRAMQIANEQAAIAQAESALAETQAKQQEQSMGLLKQLSDAGALANMSNEDIAYLEQSLPGAPSGVIQLLSNAATQKYASETQKAQFDQQKQRIDMFKDMVSAGIPIGPEMIIQAAQQTGLPAESLLQFNVAAENILKDKQLDQATKMAQLQKLGIELDRQARGITNAELEKVDYLESLYRSGASQEEIVRAKRVLGIKDEDDPMYRLDMEKKALDNEMASILNAYLPSEKIQALQKGQLDITGKEFDNIIKEAEANGASEKEILNLKKLRIETQLKDQELKEKIGSTVITSPGKYSMKADSNGGLSINVKAGAWAGQCGHFVNDVFGQRIVGDLFTQKMSLTDPDIKDPTPGMAFVMPTSTKYGHIGIVLKDNGNGTVDIVDSNWNNDEKIQYRTISKSKIAGYIPPPLGQNQHISPKGTKIDKETFDKEQALSDDFNKQAGTFIQVRDSYNKVLSAAQEPSAAGDLSLIFGYMKMLDPGSVVREGEFANAQNAAGVPVQIQNVYNRAMTGERLNKNQREDFLKQAKNIYESQKGTYDQLVTQTKKRAEDYGLDPNRVVYDFSGDATKSDPWAPLTAGLQSLLSNNFNPPSDQENPWDVVDTTSGDDILNEF